MLSESFQHRRKMLRQSLKDLLLNTDKTINSQSNKDFLLNTIDKATSTARSKSQSSTTTITSATTTTTSTTTTTEPSTLPTLPEEMSLPGMGLPIIKELPEPWATKRPEQLTPLQFIELTKVIYGALEPSTSADNNSSDDSNKKMYQSQFIWRDTRI